MQPQMPSVATDNLLQHISVAKALNGNISLGTADTYDVNKVPLTFRQDNGDGNLVRHVWTAANTVETVVHKLGRIPIGYIVVRSNVPVALFDNLTNNGWGPYSISLEANAAADVTFYIF